MFKRDILLTLVSQRIILKSFVVVSNTTKLLRCLLLKPSFFAAYSTGLKVKTVSENEAAFNKPENQQQKPSVEMVKKKIDSFSYDELVNLKSKFSNPKALIDLVLNDYIEIDRSKTPVLNIEPLINGYWKAVYKFEWPIKFSVEGKFKSKDQAIEYVYLKTCDYLEFFGFIRKNELVDTKSILFHDLVLNARLYHIKTKPLVKTWKIRAFDDQNQEEMTTNSTKSNKIWVCKTVIDWPQQITVKSYGTNEENAMRNARLLLIYKLKTMGFMDSTNRIHVISHRVYERVVNSYRERLMKRHDFELYSDASPFGFGAFLLDMNNSTAPVDYLCARFPQEYMQRLAKIYLNGKKCPSNCHFDLDDAKMSNSLEEMMEHEESRILKAQLEKRYYRKSNLEIYRRFPGYDSNMAEIYACLTALFTWKKFMKNSTVLVYTDNSGVCKWLNGPNSKQLADLIRDLRDHHTLDAQKTFGEELREELLTRVSILLYEISHKYSITFAAKLINGDENNAADSLSRFLENKFAEQIATCFNRVSAPSRTNALFVPLDGRIDASLHPSTIQSLVALKQLNSLSLSH